MSSANTVIKQHFGRTEQFALVVAVHLYEIVAVVSLCFPDNERCLSLSDSSVCFCSFFFIAVSSFFN